MCGHFYIVFLLSIFVVIKAHNYDDYECELNRKTGYCKSFCYTYHAEPQTYREAFISCFKEGGWIHNIEQNTT
uniref:Uncharacterized protein n=1 Tax=Ditylenchus dipsaci TaxID=166011 RepID=A0A915DK36_9BILA